MLVLGGPRLRVGDILFKIFHKWGANLNLEALVILRHVP